MAVKASQTGVRVLRVLEAVANHQPIGIRELARLLGEDKSAIHRAITTLVQEGWIRTTVERPVRWEVSARILAVADAAHGGYGLLQRARAVLERLRDDCGETVVLIVPDAARFVVADVVESRHELRVVPHIGSSITAEKSAAGRAMIPFLDAAGQAGFLGHRPDEALLRIYEGVRRSGYSVSERETNAGTTSIGAPVFEADGKPAAVVAVIGPSERIAGLGHERLGELARKASQLLSRGVPNSR